MSERTDASITSVRARLRALFDEANSQVRRNVIVLAIDGIPFDLAAALWRPVELQQLRSVFPTTSSTAWLSSLTGADVSEHGVPGVAFSLADGELINVYSYQGDLAAPRTGNIFSDARSAGYAPVAVLGDLGHLECSWRNLLLQGADLFGETAFFAVPGNRPANIPELVRSEILRTLARKSDAPQFIWCFIDADLHIHRNGYDHALEQCLKGLERVAVELVEGGAVVAAHSDHGLVRTKPDRDVEELLRQAEVHCDRPMGGAGRTRWLYPSRGEYDLVVTMLKERAPPGVRIEHSSLFFPPGSPASGRAGSVLVIAEGEHFLVPEGYHYEHGSLTAGELFVPFALWKR